MTRRATRFGCLTILIVCTIAIAALSWSEGGLENGAAPAVFIFIGLLIIYANDLLERRKERRRRKVPPQNDVQ